MARPKKQIKLKEPVRLREKLLNDGNRSLYLDIYHKGIRKYEFLKLYLVPELTPIDKEHNRETIKLAEQVKAERVLQIQGHGIDQWDVIKQASMPLVKWMQHYAEHPTIQLEPSSQKIRIACWHIVEEFVDSIGKPSLSLEDVDRDICRKYINFCRNLKNHRVKDVVKDLSQNTKDRYQQGLISALNHAVREGIISINPFALIPSEEKISDKDGEREFLTIQELKKLIDTPCTREDVKVAFLFSCYTGLRMSDVRVLNSSHICLSPDGKHEYIDMIMVKTDMQVVVPLSTEAKKWLPKQSEPDKPFFTLPAKATVSRAIDGWVKAAGIKKHITYHCSRHTFATSLLTLGADLYVTSKLMGHSNVKTTEIYAKVIDSKKVESVQLLDNMFDKIKPVV